MRCSTCGGITPFLLPRAGTNFLITASMIFFRKKRRLILAASVALMFAPAQPSLKAASGTWIGGSSDWTTNANWTGASFPNGAADVATFTGAALNLTPTINSTVITVGGITINAGSPTFTFNVVNTAAPATLTFAGAGVVNNSGVAQRFRASGASSGFIFSNNADAGTQTGYTLTNGASVRFTGNSTGGSAAFLADTGTRFDISEHAGTGVTVGSIAGDGSFFLGSKTLTTGTDNTSTTVSGLIQDGGLGGGTGGNLVKTGTGALTLTAANTYTGGTTLSGGTLYVDNQSASNVNNALGTGTLTISGGTIGTHLALSGTTTPGGNSSGTKLNNNIVVTGDFSIATAVVSGNAGSQNFTLGGNIDLQGATRTITGTTPQGQIHLAGVISNGGIKFVGTGAYSAFLLDGNANTYTGLTTAGNKAFVIVGGTVANQTIIGDILVESGGSLDYFGSDKVADTSVVTINSAGLYVGTQLFGGLELQRSSDTIGSLFGNGNVSLSGGGLSVGSGNFSGTINDGYLGAGGGNTFTKYGPGTMILSGTNTYSGATTVSDGILQAAAANTFSRASAVSIAAGGTLDLNNFNQGIGSLTGTGTVSLGSATLSTGYDNTTTSYGGVITGTGGITKVGTGTMTLTGASTYTGATTVNAGTVVIDTATNASVLNANSQLVLGGGTFELKGVASTVQGQVMNGLSLVAGSSVVSVDNNTGTSTTLDLSGSGGTAVITRAAGSTVDFKASTGTFGTDAIVKTAQANDASGILGAWATVNNGAALAMNDGSNVIVAYTGYTNIDALGSTIADGTNTNVRINSAGAGGDITLGAATTNINTLTQNTATAAIVDTSAGTLRLGTTGGIFITPSGSSLTIGTAPNSGTLIAGGNATNVAGEIVIGNFSGNLLTINSVIADNGTGQVSVTKTGTGTLELTATNTYTGLTTVNQGLVRLNSAGTAIAGNVLVNGGNLVLMQSNQIADGASVVVSGGLLDIGANSETVAGVQLNGGTIDGSTGVLTSTTDFELRAGTVDAILGGAVSLNKTTDGVVTIGGVNTYTGATNILAGTLRATAANTITNTSQVNVATGALFDLNNFSQSVGSLTGGGLIRLGTGRLTIGNDNSNASFSGTIEGTGGLTKQGTGTQTLAGQNYYTGSTIITTGALTAGVVDAFSPNSAVQVDTSGTMNLNNLNQTIGSLSNGVGGGGVVNLGSATLTMGANNSNTSFGGTINGTGGLTKEGSGTFTLSGSANYTGPTTVNAGLFVVNTAIVSPVTISNGSQVNINAAGSVTLGAGTTGVTANNGELLNNAGAINVGNNSTGVLGLTNNVINNTGSITGGPTGSVGVQFSGGGNVLINETGATITATTGVLLTNATGTNTIINRGTITGTGGIAINNSGSDSAVNLTNFGTINGTTLLGNANDTITFVTGFNTNAANGGGGNDTLRLVGTRAGTLNTTIITNFEYLVKLGGGNWTLTGDGFFPGGTSIQQGEVYVQGTLNSPVTVGPEGFLGGTGFIGGNVANFGAVSPGTANGTANSIGKLTVKGDYTQNKSGTLVIEVRGKKAGEYDVLSVAGAAQLDGTLRIERVGKSPRLKVGDRIAFLTAGNGVQGKFSDVHNPLTSNTMVKPEVVYENNAVVIAGVQGSYQEFANRQNLTTNQRAVSTAVDAAAFERKGDKMVAYLNERTLDKLPGDLDRIAPEELGAVYRMGVAMADTQARNLQQHTEEIRLTNRRPLRAPTPPAPPTNGAAGAVGNEQVSAKNIVRTEPEDRWGSFFTGSGQVARVGRTENARDYDFESAGLTVGVDYRVTQNLVVGVTAGYANMTSHTDGGGQISANGGRLGVYGTYAKDGYHGTAAVSGGLNSYELSRQGLGGMARGQTEGQEFNALIAGGYDWGEKAFKLGPTASLQYTYMSIDGYTERGSLAPLNVATQHQDSLRSTLGMKSAYEWNLGHVLVRPELLVAWQHEYGDRNFSIDSTLASGAGTIFTVQDSGLGRDSLLLSGGVSVLWESGTVVYLRYDGDLLRKEYDAYNVSGGVRVNF